MSPELFQSFGPILNRSRAAGSGREKIQYIGIILILQEPESLADLSVWLSVRERPVDARNGPVSGKLVCRCIVVGLVFVVVLNFRLLPLSSPVVGASLSDEKEKMYCGPWNCGDSYVSFHRSISFFVLWRMWRRHTTTEAVPRRLSTIPQIHNNKASTFPVLLSDDLFNELPGKGEVPAFAILTTYLLINLVDIITPISHV